jgi:transglutaminase-like putative cysteine protease
MRLKIAHTTTYRYEPPATGVIQILRMTPGSHDGQYVADWQIDVSTDSRLDVHEDAFGNVTHVLTHGALSDLTIHVEGLIETHDTGGVLRGTDERFPPSLFLRSTPLTEVNAAMAKFASDLYLEASGDTLGFLHALMLQINDHMTFDTDPTNSGTAAVEAFALKRGVCQDYAHIFIACARSAGVPARYVSGHLLRSDGMVNAGRRPRLGRSLCRKAWLGRLRRRQCHLHHRSPCPRRSRAGLSERRAGTGHPLRRRHGDTGSRGAGRSGRTAEPKLISRVAPSLPAA